MHAEIQYIQDTLNLVFYTKTPGHSFIVSPDPQKFTSDNLSLSAMGSPISTPEHVSHFLTPNLAEQTIIYNLVLGKPINDAWATKF